MIVFATNYDPVTQETYQLALSILDKSSTLLLGNDAVNTLFVASLTENPTLPVMIFSHGKPDYWLDNDDTPALLPTELHLLKNRKIFVYACHTAVSLGLNVAKQPNSFYWGYNNAVLIGNAERLDLSSIFLFIKQAFPLCDDLTTARVFVEKLAAQAEVIYENYLKNYPDDLDYMGAFTSLRHLWVRLEFHFDNQKYAHSDATPPLY